MAHCDPVDDGGDSSASEYGDEGDRPVYVEGAAAAAAARSQSISSLASLDDEQASEYKLFMEAFVTQLFTDSTSIQQDKKAEFGSHCQKHLGRSAFAYYIDQQNTIANKVSEPTLYALVQYFSLVLFECHESDDYKPATYMMNTSFTFHADVHMNGQTNAVYLFSSLKQLPIFQTSKYWNAACFHLMQSETRNETTQSNNTQKTTDEKLKRVLTSLTRSMRAMGHSSQVCLDFIRKQCDAQQVPPAKLGDLQKKIRQWK